MSRSAATRALAAVLAAATLPGCIVAIGGKSPSSVETPTGEKLTELERRMDRVDERLGTRVE